MKSLWADVVENGYSNIDGVGPETGLDAATEAAIADRITDDPVDVTMFTGECLTGMVAIEAALATVEGRCAVDYMRATTESAKAEVKATMEGAVADAWETLKRYVRKAWKAITEFLRKVWNKIKAKTATIKAMITKYEKVLRDSKANPKISWAQFDFAKMMQARDEFLKALDDGYESVKNSTADEQIEDQVGNKLKNYHTHNPLKVALWGNQNGPDYQQVSWNEKKSEAIAVADGKVEKIVQDYMNLGEKNEREMLNELKEAESDARDDKDDAKTKGKKNKAGNLGRVLRAKIMVCQQAATLLTSGAQAYRNQCVAACRKAIAATHGVKEGYEPTTESSSDFSSIMAEMI